LAKRWRWTDYSYLARSGFDCFTAGHQGSETGFGISTTIGDNEHAILVVDCPNQSVYEVAESELVKGRLPNNTGPHMRHNGKSFDEFIAMEVASK